MTATSLGITLPTAGDDRTLEASAAHCREITRRAARNFYHGLRLLPEPKRSQMYALYAYMRRLDDIADEDDGRSRERRIEDLDAWRERTHSVFEGRSASDRDENPDIWPAVADLVRRCSIPRHLFDAAIAGQCQDLDLPAFETFDELHEYCYRVAGVVGVASVHVWGFTGGEETLDLAVKRGVAFQLTNILRDVREDAAAGRTYLPRQELEAAGVSAESIRAGRADRRFEVMIREQVARADDYYEQSAALESRIEPDSRPTLVAMTEIYRGLLRKVAKDPGRILHERVSLSLITKLFIASRARRAQRASVALMRCPQAG